MPNNTIMYSIKTYIHSIPFALMFLSKYLHLAFNIPLCIMSPLITLNQGIQVLTLLLLISFISIPIHCVIVTSSSTTRPIKFNITYKTDEPIALSKETINQFVHDHNFVLPITQSLVDGSSWDRTHFEGLDKLHAGNPVTKF